MSEVQAAPYFTIMWLVAVLVPPGPVTVSVTVYVAITLY